MITTRRLTLIPLNMGQESDYFDDDGKLELGLGLIYVPRKLPPELKAVIQRFIIPLFIEQPENYLFFTSWIAVECHSSLIVADLAFKGTPDYKGATEVGYGTYSVYRNKGYMTEALQGLSHWAFSRTELAEITAETDKTNIASKRVLEKNGFKLAGGTADQLYWSLKRAKK